MKIQIQGVWSLNFNFKVQNVKLRNSKNYRKVIKTRSIKLTGSIMKSLGKRVLLIIWNTIIKLFAFIKLMTNFLHLGTHKESLKYGIRHLNKVNSHLIPNN